MEINVKQAKNNLSKLIAAAHEGEEIILTNRGKPVAAIVPRNTPGPHRGYGCAKGKIELSPGWDSPETDAAIAALFEFNSRRKP